MYSERTQNQTDGWEAVSEKYPLVLISEMANILTLLEFANLWDKMSPSWNVNLEEMAQEPFN